MHVFINIYNNISHNFMHACMYTIIYIYSSDYYTFITKSQNNLTCIWWIGILTSIQMKPGMHNYIKCACNEFCVYTVTNTNNYLYTMQKYKYVTKNKIILGVIPDRAS